AQDGDHLFFGKPALLHDFLFSVGSHSLKFQLVRKFQGRSVTRLSNAFQQSHHEFEQRFQREIAMAALDFTGFSDRGAILSRATCPPWFGSSCVCLIFFRDSWF
ncbi:hypothetical protein QZM81_38705, partial [Burkholderia cepacia]|uniref:hypothetical protein n=1 Tax=Burkholderia cepacia TaxID=292 RepID=UPI00265089AA